MTNEELLNRFQDACERATLLCRERHDAQVKRLREEILRRMKGGSEG